MKVINSRATLRGNPDVNSQGQVDEDGDGEEAGTADDSVNDVSAISIDDAEEEDTSPVVHTVTVSYSGTHTDITARVFNGNGWENKRIVVGGKITAKKLAEKIAVVASW